MRTSNLDEPEIHMWIHSGANRFHQKIVRHIFEGYIPKDNHWKYFQPSGWFSHITTPS